MVGVVDMEMPKSCSNCSFSESDRDDGGYYCTLQRMDTAYSFDKGAYMLYGEWHDKENCPLVEIEERKVGKWIYDKTSQNWRCSACNETPKTLGYVGTADFMAEHFKFCNHCGAEMRGNTKRKGEPIEGNNESYNCENWIP